MGVGLEIFEEEALSVLVRCAVRRTAGIGVW